MKNQNTERFYILDVFRFFASNHTFAILFSIMLILLGLKSITTTNKDIKVEGTILVNDSVPYNTTPAAVADNLNGVFIVDRVTVTTKMTVNKTLKSIEIDAVSKAKYRKAFVL